jgi:hypothetical protein
MTIGELLPPELAGIDDGAADGGAVAADIFGGGMNDDGGAMLDRPCQQGGGGVVDDQRHAERAPDIGNFADREHVELGVGQRLAKIEPRPVVGRAAEILGIGGVDEPRLDAELLQAIGEEVSGTAIEVGRGDDVVAGLDQREH